MPQNEDNTWAARKVQIAQQLRQDKLQKVTKRATRKQIEYLQTWRPEDVDKDDEEWQEYCSLEAGYLSDVGSGSDSNDQMPKVTGACWRRFQPVLQHSAAQGDGAIAHPYSSIHLQAPGTAAPAQPQLSDDGMLVFLGDVERQDQRSTPKQKVFLLATPVCRLGDPVHHSVVA